nr:E3 ubiquitin-protein ligase RNF213 [Marmota flaviventris]
MECPQCQHVSQEEAPKFCSQCGQRLPPATPRPDSEDDSSVVAPALEEEMECGKVLKENGDLHLSPGSSDRQENAAEPSCDDGTWTVQRSKRKKRKKNQDTSASSEPSSLALSASIPQSPNSPSHPGSQDTALDQSQAQQGQTAPRKGAEEAQNSPVLQDHSEGKDLHTAASSGDSDPSQEVFVPPTSACEAHPKAEGAAQGLPLPESQGDSKPQKDAQRARQQAGVPASGEGETRDRLAAPGKKAGENSSEPTDHRKPEGSDRNYAAAVKKEKEQKNQKASAQAVPPSLLSPEEGVTVYFHAIISKHFAFDPELHTVFIRGGEELGRPGWSDACEMFYVEDLRENGSLIEGSIVIPRGSLDRAIPYKYVLHRGPNQAVEYEYIYKQPQRAGEHVNRCLCIKPSLVRSGDWHQYDDIICMKPPGKLQKLQNFFNDKTKKDLVKGKQMAAEIMLGRIFSILQTWNPINLKNFFTQFRQFYSVVRVPMIYEGKAQPWLSLGLGESEVKKHLWKYLKRQIGPFLEGKSGDALPESCPVRSRLRMGLVVLFLVEDAKLYLSEGDLTSLCSILCPSTCSPDALHSDLSHILGASERWREYLVNLCQRCMDAKVIDWLGILPVLHYCMQLAPPRKDFVSQPEDTWAALEGISFSQFQKEMLNENQFLSFMESRKQLLCVDEYLFRSWFSLLPLGSLVPYMENSTEYLSLVPTRVLDCFLGTHYRLQGLQEISYQNVEVVERVFNMLIHLVDIYQDMILEKTSLESYLTVCLKLHEAVCKITKTPKYFEIPALSACVIGRVLGLGPAVDMAEDPGAAAWKGSVTSVLQGVLATTRSWLRRVFVKSMFQKRSTVQFSYPEEIKVWRRLVGINFPAECGWKESLLGDMEGRLKQERPVFQISVFCSTLWDAAGLQDSVAKRFEKCVIEAVSSACQSQTSVLEGVSCHDLQKFGSLVSAVITKSWPRNNGEAVDDLDEILKHLLTGPDVKQLFKLYGTDEKLLDNLTEDAKRLMAAANSVFMKVAGDVLDGSILIGQLELILKHRTQFLDLWQLEKKSFSFQEGKCDMKETLEWRRGEVVFLKSEKRQVDSLLRLSRKVKHLVQGSSFPRDQEYTQICRNINRVKICMETGKMVVLLNLQHLYESLYDALNQYYVYLGGQKYVDLGLGTHRVKCRVHPDFRLIVVEEKNVVYEQFPVPLINRLEKHYLDLSSVLQGWQKSIVQELTRWAEQFANVKAHHQFLAGHKYSPADVFIGYHSDACASVVLQAVERQGPGDPSEELYHRVFEEAKRILLDCATPDAMVRLSTSALGSFAAQSLSQEYWNKQQHHSFADFLQAHLRTADLERHAIFTEVTTFSRLLTSHDCEALGADVKGLAPKPVILSLQQFDTEYSFLKEVRSSLVKTARCKILIVQMDFDDGAHSAQLVASAKYSAINEVNKMQGTQGCVFIYFITKLSRMGSGASYVGFHGGLWRSVHIDDLRRSTVMASDVTKLQSFTISQLFMPGGSPELKGNQEEVMEAETSKSGEVTEEELEREGPEEMGCEAADLRDSDAQVLDTTRLLRSCVQSAVGMLRDQESCPRNVRRVTVLLSLLSGVGRCSAAFLRISKERLSVLLKKQEENQLRSLKEWVGREAANQDALQEAGTFRHTLWKRVQGMVTPLLASMISFIDRDGNLELLIRAHSPVWVQDMWMFIFRDTKFLNIPLVLNNTRSKSEMSSIVVQNHMSLPEGACSSVPFSWRIRDYLDELWVKAQYITDTKGQSEKLVEIFQQTPLGMFLAQIPEDQQQELVQCYSRDFLLLTMRVSNQEELEFLQMALWSCVCELRAASGRPEDGLCLPWVHLAYQHFRTRLHNFSRIVTTHPQVLQSLTEAAQKHDIVGSEMTLDVLAAVACAEMLTGDTLKPSAQAWLQLVRKLSIPLDLVCSDGYLQGSGSVARAVAAELRTQWNRVFPLALFVEHVLLGTESQIPELCQLVTKYVFSLDKCLQENSNLKTQRPFMAVMTTLCECKEQASKSLARFGVQPCPICLGDAQDPVCLPCDHVYCLPCIKSWLVPGQMICPYCLTDLPDKFSVTVSREHRVAIGKHAQFRQMCNSFFVDLVSTVCFKDNTPPQKSVIDGLLSLLFVQKELLRDAPQRHREHTKSLSPFDDAVDKTPVIRSVVLKLLLKYSFDAVKDYIQAYLSLLEKKAFITEDKTELYMLFINCLEDSIQEKTSAYCTQSELQCLREEGRFLQTCSSGRRGQGPATAASVEYLQEVARTRLCLDRASDLLLEIQEGSELAEEQQCYLRHVEQFCTRAGNDWHRVYLVRRLASLRGMEFVQSLSRQGRQCQWVFPKGVTAQQKDHTGQMDRYLVYGDEYKALRDAVGKAMLKGKAPSLEAALTACRSPGARQVVYLLLVLYREVAALHCSRNKDLHPKPEQCEAVSQFIEDSRVLSPPGVRPFAASLVNNTLPLLSTGPGVESLEGTVTEMAVHAAAVLLCGQSEVLAPLRNLAFSPASMANAFLPTMPEDLLAQAQKWRGLEGVRWYNCPNGHPCSVGECGMPMEQGSCVDCGALIGGVDHKPHAGFLSIRANTDRTRTGHVLGHPQHRGVVVVSDRELSPVVFILIRLLTHLAMLLGATQSPKALINIIKPPVRDPRGFLQQHIQRDLKQLTKTLGKSADETTHVVHLILRCLLKEQCSLPGQRHLNFDAELSTKERRNNWEKHVASLLLPELEHLDKTLLTVSTLISQDERVSSNPVAKIIYGDPANFLPRLPQKNVVHCSKIWSCRKKITVEYLQHVVEQKNGKEMVPMLWQFLQKEAELRLVKFLPEILALQRDLVKQFQNVPEDEYSTIRSFISSHSSDGLRQLFHNRITIFLSTWNALRRSLETNGEIKLPKEYCSSDLDLDTDFKVILPRRQGLGLCSTALVSYLINLHNEIIHTVEKFSKENNSYSVDASEVTDLHVVSYEVERDLIPLILSNCQYQVEQGGKTSQEFDLEKIQQQISSRFLQGKPLLTLKGIPTLVYRHDWNFEHLFTGIKNKMAQSPLPSSAIGAISGQLQSYSDACEALSVVEVTLGFLGTAGGDPNMHLNAYVQDILRMGDQTTPVLEALSRGQLKHAIALWQFLSAHKSEQLLRLKKDPFREISSMFKADLSPESAKLLSTFLNHTDLDAFLLELHEMMVLKLRNTQTQDSFNPEWSLRDTLVSYMETKDSDILPEVESQFPEEILLSSCVSVWKAAAARKQDRQAR